MDLSGAVIKQFGETVGEGASFTQSSAEQSSFKAAAVAEEIAGNSRTVTADRRASAASSWQQTLHIAAGAGAVAAGGLVQAVPADWPI
ncbi:hypothetical protein IV500_17315 [Paeniglutamicibacter antarcticus]|uniref:Uncharacterized protein n=1 Tax=Arthrobacter terrae TaxID=2935737 RepID=A0A931G6K2_9MICC|nr:hypothetical protein [Arthrobacter terrae]MBG0741133.1 hypothetical protein [Arthrobacter terrae]